jgi:hypothetical protein
MTGTSNFLNRFAATVRTSIGLDPAGAAVCVLCSIQCRLPALAGDSISDITPASLWYATRDWAVHL